MLIERLLPRARTKVHAGDVRRAEVRRAELERRALLTRHCRVLLYNYIIIYIIYIIIYYIYYKDALD